MTVLMLTTVQAPHNNNNKKLSGIDVLILTFVSIDSDNNYSSESSDVVIPLDPFNYERDEIMHRNNNLNTKQ